MRPGLNSSLRERHKESAAAAGLTVEPNCAALKFDQFPRNRKPEARAFVNRRWGAVKLFKHFFVMLAGNPTATVRYGDRETSVLRQVRPNHEVTSLRSEFECIMNEV